ncbi:hypothetical protein GIB67_042887 [Kingdonia uniflora]|uniref:tyrosine decarboxylase n=1 Tax=Kingdonia uniflora TaxID=39325 RepID=A0A7J7LUY8_9MAGN|nr:hypothetical protein GIB67_042887 [Kingdonia uniflora]
MDSLPTEIFNPLELNSFVGESHAVLDFLSDYCKDVESYPAQSQVIPGFLKKGCPDYAPNSLELLESILDDVCNNIIPGLSLPSEIFNPLKLDSFFGESHAKATKLVGILPLNFRPITTLSSAEFALSPSDVRMAMKQDLTNGLFPLFFCATIDTTAAGAVNPLIGLGLVARDYGMWLHVDAAYAGSACISPKFRPYLDGVELCDSISMNPHKWFHTNMDCRCLWLTDRRSLIESLSTNPEFLKNKASESHDAVDFMDRQLTLSRRFRSINLWVIIQRYGVANLRNHVRKDVELAKHFDGLIATDCKFEVVVPRKFALVGFRLD